jgi:hypothetical protein
MLRYCLARHMQSLPKFSERLAILPMRAVEQPWGLASARARKTTTPGSVICYCEQTGM